MPAYIQNHTCRVTLLQPARRAAVLDQSSSLRTRSRLSPYCWVDFPLDVYRIFRVKFLKLLIYKFCLCHVVTFSFWISNYSISRYMPLNVHWKKNSVLALNKVFFCFWRMKLSASGCQSTPEKQRVHGISCCKAGQDMLGSLLWRTYIKKFPSFIYCSYIMLPLLYIITSMQEEFVYLIENLERLQ
jgi:hypothetical protein